MHAQPAMRAQKSPPKPKLKSKRRVRSAVPAKPPLSEDSFRLGSPGEEDDLREELGEAYVQSMTSGAQAAEEFRDEEGIEERGGPFIETTADVEFAHDTDASNPPDAERAPFPIVSSQP